MKIKGILLDIDDTLYDYDQAHEAALEACFIFLKKDRFLERHEFNEAYEKAKKKVHGALKGTASCHNRLLYFQQMCEDLKIDIFKYAWPCYCLYWDVFLGHLQVSEGVYDFLTSLKEKKVCLLSDLTADIQFRKIQKMKLDEHVDFLVTSEEAGYEKPHACIFKLALDKLGLACSDICMIGDDYAKDIEGALNLGIRSFWMNKKGEKKPFHSLVTEFKNFSDLRGYFL